MCFFCVNEPIPSPALLSGSVRYQKSHFSCDERCLSPPNRTTDGDADSVTEGSERSTLFVFAKNFKDGLITQRLDRSVSDCCTFAGLDLSSLDGESCCLLRVILIMVVRVRLSFAPHVCTASSSRLGMKRHGIERCASCRSLTRRGIGCFSLTMGLLEGGAGGFLCVFRRLGFGSQLLAALCVSAELLAASCSACFLSNVHIGFDLLLDVVSIHMYPSDSFFTAMMVHTEYTIRGGE